MNISEYKKIAIQLDRRIYEQAEREAKKAVIALQGAVEGELLTLGIDPLFSGMHEFLDTACVAHINNLVGTRTAALVKQLAPDQHVEAPKPHKSEQAIPQAADAAMPPIPSMDADGLVLILAKMLAQLEIQTEIMADNLKKADSDSKLYQEALKTHSIKSEAAAAQSNYLGS